jgi:hypothetical protein
MKSLKLIGLSLLAALALAAFAAASASAEEGFLPTSKANILGGLTILETSSGSKVHCGKLDSSPVTFSNDKHFKATLHWLECTEGTFGQMFNSLGAKPGEVLVPVLVLVCLDPKDATGKLIDEYGVSVEIEGKLHLEVPTLGVLLEVLGAALGAVLTKGKAKLFVVEFTNNGIAGEQTVKDCLEGANVKLHNLLISTNHGAEELVSVDVQGGLIQFEKETELMDS